MSCEFSKRLSAKLNSSKSNNGRAAFGRRMHLTQGDDGFSVILLIERDQETEAVRIVFDILTVLNFDQAGCVDPKEIHAIGEPGAVRGNHVETPYTASANIGLVGLNTKAFWPEPLGELGRIGPCLEGGCTVRINDTSDNDFPI